MCISHQLFKNLFSNARNPGSRGGPLPLCPEVSLCCCSLGVWQHFISFPRALILVPQVPNRGSTPLPKSVFSCCPRDWFCWAFPISAVSVDRLSGRPVALPTWAGIRSEAGPDAGRQHTKNCWTMAFERTGLAALSVRKVKQLASCPWWVGLGCRASPGDCHDLPWDRKKKRKGMEKEKNTTHRESHSLPRLKILLFCNARNLGRRYRRFHFSP